MGTMRNRNADGSEAARSKHLLHIVWVLVMLMGSGVLGCAQTSAASSGGQTAHPPGNISTPHQLVITGCLRRDSAGVYSITNENGKTFNLISAANDVDLSKHVFHAVRITGKEAPNVEPPAPANPAQQSPPLSALRVLTLEVLSNSCTR